MTIEAGETRFALSHGVKGNHYAGKPGMCFGRPACIGLLEG